MATQRKLNLYVVCFPYSGNSTGSSMSWPTTEWLVREMIRLKTDEKFTSRIDEIRLAGLANTPITMTRNLAVKQAQEAGYDLVMMIDSDMHPDVLVGEDPSAVPFLDAAFDYIYEHYDEGPNFVAAPYGGAPPHENVFGFKWEQLSNLGNEAPFELRQYLRSEVVNFEGIQDAAAAATGVILYDIRCFDYINPPYFQYEWEDKTESVKASTEDVQNTRDISLSVQKKLGYNPCKIAWSSWAGHLKVWCVKKPHPYNASTVAENLADALSRPDPRESGKLVQVENLLGPATRRLFSSGAVRSTGGVDSKETADVQ